MDDRFTHYVTFGYLVTGQFADKAIRQQFIKILKRTMTTKCML